MEINAYLSLKSFINGILKFSEKTQIEIEFMDLLNQESPECEDYGLSVLRKSILEYEKIKQIPIHESKSEMPFFRKKRRMLIGPEIGLFVFPLYESDVIPEKWKKFTEPYVILRLDYEVLTEYCLQENLFLLKCRYDEDQNIEYFIRSMEKEYDKFFYDDEHSGFTRDSRFFSLLYNACMEVADPKFAVEKEWRLALFSELAGLSFQYENGRLNSYVKKNLPLNCIRKITLYDPQNEGRNYSALAIFLQSVGLVPDRYLSGLIEY